EVWLEKAPLKYEGLSYTEIWISEAQERMVFAVPEQKWDAFQKLCERESVEAIVIGQFVPTGRLTLKYNDQLVADLSMDFLHDGRPPVVRKATFEPKTPIDFSEAAMELSGENGLSSVKKILGSLNVASKHWIIRQYDYEVQGGSVLKPLVGVANDGPGDAAVVRPKLDSDRGVVVSCGMNPHYGDLDPYHMAASSIDEAIRNCVAVGADPDRIAILDNFCWGFTDRPETLGSLVRSAIACHDISKVYRTPFISGKDSLNNEFSYHDETGVRKTISIPSTMLISAMGQVEDVSKCVSMDAKSAGNLIYAIGPTGNHLGGSHFALVNGLSGGSVPTVDPDFNLRTFRLVHSAINQRLVRSCHDLSEGGLAVAAAEMAFAGGLGMELDVQSICERDGVSKLAALFSESNGRFIVEVNPQNQQAFESLIGDRGYLIGQVIDEPNFVLKRGEEALITSPLMDLKEAWQTPLDWK
ncbi:MAG: AIR synthase-related protein, partial [Planctomycetota bacterium]